MHYSCICSPASPISVPPKELVCRICHSPCIAFRLKALLIFTPVSPRLSLFILLTVRPLLHRLLIPAIRKQASRSELPLLFSLPVLFFFRILHFNLLFSPKLLSLFFPLHCSLFGFFTPSLSYLVLVLKSSYSLFLGLPC